uniref:Uncharacterized protein n=1 Tax=Sus scrofa TaxID=9823 RepID=A0A4X1SPJ5_PIG
MVSWFGTLGSSLGRSLGQVGGSMASLTGHNSNVTKAVLRKGDEQGPEDVPESKTKEVEDVQGRFWWLLRWWWWFCCWFLVFGWLV